jgi:hypothetical protein
VGQEQHRIGDVVRFSDEQTCETAGCGRKTRDRIWMGERWRYTCEDHQAGVREELLGGSQGSGFMVTCGRPDCDAPWVGTVGAPSVSSQASEKPHVVICANSHKFAVLEMRSGSDGPTAYRLGPQIGGG